MFTDIGSLLVFIIVFVLVAFYRKALKPKGLPPGPVPTPFIGDLGKFHKNKYTYLTLYDLTKKYGPLFSLQLGWKPAIVISDLELLKDAFIGKADHFSNRNRSIFNYIVQGESKGIISGNGEIWKTSRRLAMSTLRDFGLGRSSLEVKVQEEAKAMLVEIQKCGKDENVDFDDVTVKATSNIICGVLFGTRHDYDDEEFHSILGNMNDFLKEATQFNLLVFLPFLIPFLFLKKELYMSYKYMKLFRQYVGRKINEHRKNFDANHIKDFIDVFLDAEQQNKGGKAFIEKNLHAIVLDLFFGGTETSAVTLCWGLYFMVKHPEVQEKCRAEIHRVIGLDRTPSMADKEQMPFTEATIAEIQRISTIAPQSVFHCSSGEANLHGYSIPHQCVVIPNLYYIHMDPNKWENPDKFNPERFIKSNGEIDRVMLQNLVTFSLGKRICLGENLARMELFIFFTSLLQHFKFTNHGELADLFSAKQGITLRPPEYNLRAELL